jgi:hypothetical protein
MKKILIFSLLGLLLAVACRKDPLPQPTDGTIKGCAEIFLIDTITNGDNIGFGVALTPAYLWQPGQTLRIRFLGGSSLVQSKVRQFAEQWLRYANIKYNWVASGDSEIKIQFTPGGSWSYVGKQTPPSSSNEPTMNFGWFDDGTSDTEFQRTTVHEFGHALGLKHEHQHPKNNIPWDVPAVYRYYAQQGWTQAQVDQHVLNRYTTDLTQFSDYCPSSIMHYPIPNQLTIGDFEVGWNTSLATCDIDFIKSLYPQDNRPFGSFDVVISGYGNTGGEAQGDYDGDGKVDIGLHQNGKWYIDYANNGFGSWDKILNNYGSDGGEAQGDYDGDGKTDIGLHKDGKWYIDYANNGFGSWDKILNNYGSNGGEAQGDYDGDGKTDIGLHKDGKWYIDYANNGFGSWDKILNNYGSNGGEAQGDYDGDGKTDIGLHKDGKWYIDYANNGFGSWDKILNNYGSDGGEAQGDYDGDGKTDIGLHKDGKWHIDYANNGFGSWDAIYDGYGKAGGEAQGDYNGDGKDDIGIHQNNVWHIDYAK